MDQETLGRDAAAAATQAILERFFWPYPEEQMRVVGAEIFCIIEAATEKALEIQRQELLQSSPN